MEIILNTKHFQILFVVIIMDCFFGILRALKQRKLNSTIGIDGIIRKIGMIAGILFLIIINYLIPFDFLGFVPEEMKNFIHIRSWN